MSRVDRINRSLELKLVFWGPAQSGKTTALRSLHGACDARRRGEFASISGERGDAGGTCAFDYVPLELPRFRDYDLRVDCYTVPGFAGYEATRRRLLRGADGVVFVADVSPEGVDGNVESWQALDRLLRVAEANDSHPVPVVALANKNDVDDARDAAYLRAQLVTSCGRRVLLDACDGIAGTGQGVVRAFRKVVVAAAARALEPLESMHLTGGGFGEAPGVRNGTDDAFLDALGAQFEGLDDGVPVEEAVPGRTVSVERPAEPAAAVADDMADDEPAQETPAPRTRDQDRRERRREAALGRLLVDVANACASATDDEGAARSVLIQLVMNLDAVSGWVGLADVDEGEVIYDPMGRARDASSVAEAAQALSMGLLDDSIIPVGAAATAGFPGGAAGGRGVFLQFTVSGSEPGWLLLVGAPGRGLPTDTEPAIRTAAAILGLTVARLHALDQLRSLNRALEQKVTDRTAQLQREKTTLEDRVRDRTRQLEKAKRKALETERMLFDRGRTEGVRQVAAGLAHELNNPLSAVFVNLKYALELLEDTPAGEAQRAEWLVELSEAVMDAASEAAQAAERVSTLFARDVAATRRAAVRTNLRHAVLEAVEHYHQVYPQSPLPEVVGAADVTTGIQRAELTRWVFRVLGGVTTGADCGALVSVEEAPDGPHLTLDLDGPIGTGASDMLAAIAREVQRAGGRLDAEVGVRRCRIEVLLPPALGGRGAENVWERSA